MRFDVEEFRQIRDYPDYLISNHGNVISRKQKKWRHLRANVRTRFPYLCVGLHGNGGQKTKPVHQLVAEAFIGPRPEGMDVRHLDDNKLNNHISNIAYGTKRDNWDDCKRNGFKGKSWAEKKVKAFVKVEGERRDKWGRKLPFERGHHNCKLADSDVCEIKSLYESGHTQYEIASRFNITQPHVSNILRKKRRALP